MNKIKVLSENMINLVSAGEVVNRPSSVVKELVENSIDANSSCIEIEIKNGGKRLIRISDNGDGISRNDIKTAFLKHATSKICNEDDLEKISSLGFRGEALSSICAVSKVEITTSHLGENVGTRYGIDGGQETFISDCAFSKGTSVCVNDLFYNVPARMKFLKNDYSEGNHISVVVDNLCLSHPEISFKFIKDNKLIFHTPGDGKLSSVISRIFSVNFFKSLMKIDYKFNNISVKGFISDPMMHSSSKIQNFFVNGRWIKNKIISNAIESALKDEYQNSKVSSIVYLNVPMNAIDVNVHPEKTEVRFENEKIIFECIYNSVKNAILFKKNQFINKIEDNSPIIKEKNSSSNENNLSFVSIKKKEVPSINEQTMNILKNLKKKTILSDNVIIPQKNNNEISNDNLLKLKRSIFNVDASKNHEQMIISESFKEKELKIIGEIFQCFFVVEYGDEALLIDKHAAHERIIFEKLNKMEREKSSQILMSPIVVDLSKSDYNVIIENLPLINELGYLLEDFGYGKILVRGIPFFLEISDVNDSLFKISDFLTKNKSNVKIDDLKELYSSIACKSSIKAGKKSTDEEIKFLVRTLMKSNVSSCPHGRPIYIEFKKDDIYKKFLRK